MQDFLPESPDLNQILNQLERTDLDQVVPGLATPLWGELEKVPFLHIEGLAAYWQRTELGGYSRVMEDVISGLNGQGEDFYFMILGQANRLSIYVGAGTRSSQPDMSGILKSAFPGISIASNVESQLGHKLECFLQVKKCPIYYRKSTHFESCDIKIIIQKGTILLTKRSPFLSSAQSG